MSDSSYAVHEYRKDLWRMGYRPVPVRTNKKAAFGMDWAGSARLNPPHVISQYPVSEALSTGILTDGLVAVDIDVDEPAIATEIERLARQVLGNAPKRYRQESPRTSLHWAAFAIADKIQCPPAIAALSVLGAASLAVQAHADVMLPKTGHTKPLSLFLVSIGASGERKSAAEALYEWLTTKWTESYVGLSVMYQRGPTAIRDAKTAKAAVATLVDHGWLVAAPTASLVAGKAGQRSMAHCPRL